MKITNGMKHSTTATYGNVASIATITNVYSNTWGDFVDMAFEDGSTISMFPQEELNIVK